MSFRNKTTISYHIKGLYKTTCYKTKSNFSQFSFLIDCCMSVFLFPYENVCNFWEIDKIHQQAFFVYKIGKNLETLIEMFCQKLKFLMLFWPFKTISNLKFSSLANMEPLPPFLKSLDPPRIMVQWFRWISFLSSARVWAPGVVVIMLLFNLLSFCYHEIKYFCCLKWCLVELKLATCFLLSKPESWLTKHGKNVTKKIKNVFDKIVVIFITLIRLIFGD